MHYLLTFVLVATVVSSAHAEGSEETWCDEIVARMLHNLERDEFKRAASILQYPDSMDGAEFTTVHTRMTEAFRTVVRELGHPGHSRSTEDPGDLNAFGLGAVQISYWIERDPNQSPAPKILRSFRSVEFSYDGQMIVGAMCSSEGLIRKIRRVRFLFPGTHSKPRERMFELTRLVDEAIAELPDFP